MTQEDMERTTIDNAKAIGELTIIAKQTSKDVDKLITHLDTVPTTRIVSLEKRVSKTEESSRTFISGTVIRWAMSGLVSAVLLYMVHMEDVKDEFSSELHRIDNLLVNHIRSEK